MGNASKQVDRARSSPGAGLSHIAISVVSTGAPLDFARGKLHAEWRDLRSTISGLWSREGLSARAGGPPVETTDRDHMRLPYLPPGGSTAMTKGYSGLRPISFSTVSITSVSRLKRALVA